MSVLLDSVILIDHLNGRDVATEYLRRTRDVSISVITRAEVLAGLDSDSAGPAFQAAAGLRPGVDANCKVGGRPHFAPAVRVGTSDHRSLRRLKYT